MAERTGTISITERRLKGEHFGNALARYQGVGEALIIPLGPSDLFFGRVVLVENGVSGDLRHAIAWGVDGDEWTLLRDGGIVFSEQARFACVLAANGDFSRMVASVDKGEYKDVHLIADGASKHLGSWQRLVGNSPNLERILLSRVDKLEGGTAFAVLDEQGEQKLSFVVKNEYPDPELTAANTDFSTVIWRGRKHSFWGTQRQPWQIFRNEELVVEGSRVAVYANRDLSTFWAIAQQKGLKSPLTVVFLNGGEILRSPVSFRDPVFTEDCSLGVILTTSKHGSRVEQRLLALRSDGQVRWTKPFDALVSLIEEEGQIKASVMRGSADRDITISRS